MKRVIGWIINHIPRPIMQRVAGWMVPIIGLLYLGKGKECPICRARRRKFLPYGYTTQRDNALCPNCLSLERHRLMWLYITRESNLLTELPSLIHIAPEVSISKRLKKAYNVADRTAKYVTADLESPLATMHFDVQQIPLADNSFEVVICNHLLEHVNSDITAMAELYRIMKPNGWGILLSPVEYNRATTYEDDTITDPSERTRIFGQYDHRRIYGRDYADRLRSVGFSVNEVDYSATLTQSEVNNFALTREIIYVVRKSISPL